MMKLLPALMFASLFLVPTVIFGRGIPDADFGTMGVVTVDLGSEASVRSLAQQDDGKIIVVGRDGGTIVLLRLNTDGSIDTGFGSDGKVVTPYSSTDETVSLTVQADANLAVGNNSQVTRYGPDGSLIGTVTFPAGDFAAFGRDGTIATASLVDAAGSCSGQPKRIRFDTYMSDGAAGPSTLFCSGGAGTTGITTIWGVVAGQTGSFYVGYTHRALSASNGRVRELNGITTIDDRGVDPGIMGYSLVDLAATISHGFVSLGYAQICRQLPAFQSYMQNLLPTTPIYKRLHGNNRVAALKDNSSILVLNENMEYSGIEDLRPLFAGAVQQSSVYVQSDDKVLVAGQVASGTGHNNIRLVRYKTVVGAPARTSDFDHDQKADIAVWRPSDGIWYKQGSSDDAVTATQFGTDGDRPVSADIDGDGVADEVVWRPSSGQWYWINSSTNTFGSYNLGEQGDLPVPAYYDNDEKSDIGVYRPSTGTWWILYTHGAGVGSTRFGADEDIPTVGDFNGDGLSDIAVWRPSVGIWYRRTTSGGFVGQQFGVHEDVPVPADYDGDGRTDVAVFRPSTGVWYVLNSSDAGLLVRYFGVSEDKPVPADYDGDGRSDIGVFRPSEGIWYIDASTRGFFARQFGTAMDVPVPNALLR